MPNPQLTRSPDLDADVDSAGRIQSVPSILNVICRITGMGFAALARVTEDRWIACQVQDEIGFGLKPGEELKVETTICHEVRHCRVPIAIDHVAQHDFWRNHHTPAMYGFQSYISVPVILPDGSFFGTLCAIDPHPARVNTPEVLGMLQLFAELIAKHLDDERKVTVAEEDRRYWRNLLLQVPSAIAVLRGPDHCFEWVNDGYARLVGRSSSDLVGKTILEAIPEFAGQVYGGLLDRVYHTGQAFFGYESPVCLARRTDTLEEVYVNFVYLPTKNEAGEVNGIFAHITEVTDTVLARQRIEQSQERFRQLADSMPQIVWTAQPDGRHDYHNARWHEFSGFDPVKDAGKGWTSILHPDDERKTCDTWETSVQSGDPFQIEARLHDVHRNCWRWFMCRAIAVRDESGRVVKWFGTCTDIDDHKASQYALLQAQKLESIGILAGGIAHDFNNLLVGIMGGASFALETIPPSNPAYELLETVVSASERAADLTRQMLAYAGKASFVIERVNISEMVLQTVKLVHASIAKSVRIQWELDDHLTTVETDPGQMQQVLMNLIINAAESLGGHPGVVVIRTRPEKVLPGELRRSTDGTLVAPGLYAVLEVQDTGCGMSAGSVSKIFDPFYTTKFTGRGLGLAAVSGVVRMLRGGIEVETEPGKGSTFRVLLPASPLTAPPDAAGPADPTAAGSETVLVIDDEEVVRSVARAALERAGYRILVADGGDAGLEDLRNTREIALVLLDLNMPGMSGSQTMEALREIRPDVPVVICSGYSEDEVKAQFAGTDIAGVLQKPFTAEKFVSKVKSILQASRA